MNGPIALSAFFNLHLSNLKMTMNILFFGEVNQVYDAPVFDFQDQGQRYLITDMETEVPRTSKIGRNGKRLLIRPGPVL
jgi:hypothetical protein